MSDTSEILSRLDTLAVSVQSGGPYSYCATIYADAALVIRQLERRCLALEAERMAKAEVAFVQGVAWWEHQTNGATIWQSDRRKAEEEAKRRKEDGTLAQIRAEKGDG